MALTIDAVLAAKDQQTVVVPCPEWGGDVHLVTMESSRFDEFEARLTFGEGDPAKLAGLRAEYVAACWADEEGNRANVNAHQARLLKQRSPVVMGRLFEAAHRLNTDVEEAEKN